MRSKRTGGVLIVAASLSAVLALSACSGSAGQSPTGTSSAGAGSMTVENFNYLTSGSELEGLQAMFAVVQQQYPQLTIKNDAVSGGGGSNLDQVLQTRIAGNDAPDTWQSHPGAAIQTYAKAGLLADLTPLYEKNGWKDVIPKDILDAISYDGKIYGVLFGINRINVVWYSKANADKLGISVGDSLSWSDMTADIAKAQAGGIQPVCLGGKDPFVTAELVETAVISRIGADGWTQLTAGTLSWTDSKVAEGLQDYLTVLHAANSNYTALTWDQGAKMLADNQCLFLPLVDSAYGELLKGGAKDGTDFGYVAYPGTDSIVLNVADLMVESSKLEDRTAADLFLTGIGTSEAELAYQKIKGQVPVRTDADVSGLGAYQQDLAKNVKSDTIVQSLTFGQSNSPTITNAYLDAVTALNANGDVDAFAKTMDSAFHE